MHTYEYAPACNADKPWRVGYREPGLYRLIKRFASEGEALDYVIVLNQKN